MNEASLLNFYRKCDSFVVNFLLFAWACSLCRRFVPLIMKFYYYNGNNYITGLDHIIGYLMHFFLHHIMIIVHNHLTLTVYALLQRSQILILSVLLQYFNCFFQEVFKTLVPNQNLITFTSRSGRITEKKKKTNNVRSGLLLFPKSRFIWEQLFTDYITHLK